MYVYICICKIHLENEIGYIVSDVFNLLRV